MSLLDTTLKIPDEIVTATSRPVVPVVQSFLQKHLVTIVTYLVVALALIVSMHFPVYLGPLHGHPAR